MEKRWKSPRESSVLSIGAQWRQIGLSVLCVCVCVSNTKERGGESLAYIHHDIHITMEYYQCRFLKGGLGLQMEFSRHDEMYIRVTLSFDPRLLSLLF